MESLSKAERQGLINAIATRQGTVRQLAERYDATPDELREFTTANLPAIEAAKRRLTEPEDTTEAAATLTPVQLDDLWITNKFERLKRLQVVAEETYGTITTAGAFASAAEQAMAVREFRSYLMLAANELGQLLHRGSGDAGTGDTLSVDMIGVDMETLR